MRLRALLALASLAVSVRAGACPVFDSNFNLYVLGTAGDVRLGTRDAWASRAPSPAPMLLAPAPGHLSVPTPRTLIDKHEYLTPPPSPSPDGLAPATPVSAVGVRRLRKTPRGAFLPFSEGTRACSGADTA